MALTIPGNLIVKNGGHVISTGDQSWHHEEIYKEGCDTVVDGGKLEVEGEIIIGGEIIICDEDSYSMVKA